MSGLYEGIFPNNSYASFNPVALINHDALYQIIQTHRFIWKSCFILVVGRLILFIEPFSPAKSLDDTYRLWNIDLHKIPNGIVL